MANGDKTGASASVRVNQEADASPHVTDMLVQKIASLSRALDKQAEAMVAKRTDMTLLECRILAYVEAHGPVAVSDIASGMFIDAGQTSRLASKLVQVGYLVRKPNADDQRSAHLSLSPRGQTAYARMQRSVLTWNNMLIDQVTPNDIKALNATLDRFTSFVAAYTRQTAPRR